MKEKIIWIIAREQNIPPTDIGLATRFDMLEMDSLDLVCLLQIISEELNLREIPKVELLKIDTVGSLVEAYERI